MSENKDMYVFGEKHKKIMQDFLKDCSFSHWWDDAIITQSNWHDASSNADDDLSIFVCRGFWSDLWDGEYETEVWEDSGDNGYRLLIRIPDTDEGWELFWVFEDAAEKYLEELSHEKHNHK